MKKAVIIFCLLFVLTLGIPALTNAVIQTQEKGQTSQSELVTIFNEEKTD